MILVRNALVGSGLKPEIKLAAAGKVHSGAGMAMNFGLGADFCNAGRAFMFALGCIQSLKCNQNCCPTGITTHKKRLQKGLDPASKAVRVSQYAQRMVKEIGIIAHSCGAKEPRALKRMHCRLVTDTGRSVPCDE